MVDCGAHIGMYSVLAGRVMKNGGTILAIEPNPDTLPLLRENLELNQVTCAKVIEGAASSGEGTQTLYAGDEGKAAYSSLHIPVEGGHQVPVCTFTLDSLLDEQGIEHVDFLKIDVEGAEIDVWNGCEKSIAAGRVQLVMVEFTESILRQTRRSTEMLVEAWEAKGYRWYRLDEDTLQLVPVVFDGPVWYENFFAARDVEPINQRLAEAAAEHRRIAKEVITRGQAARVPIDRAEAAEQRAEAEEQRAEVSEQRAEVSEQRAEAVEQRAERAEAMTVEADKRSAEAAARAERADALADETRRVLDVVQDHALHYGHRLLRVVQSVPFRLAWKLRLRRKPAWVDGFRAEVNRISSIRPDETDRPATAGETSVPLTAWKYVFALGTQMAHAIEHLVEKGFDPRVTVDVGAARGYWSLNVGYLFPNSEFYMIDPLVENEPSLKQICHNNSRFHYVLTAVGDRPGESRMNLTPDLEGSSLLEYYGPGGNRQRVVQVATLDQLIRKSCVQAPHFVKIDVQGFEMHVLHGGGLIFNTAEVLIIETNLFKFMPDCPRVHEVVGYLAERDFFLFDIAGSLRRPYQNDLAQMDLVFVSARSELASSNRWS